MAFTVSTEVYEGPFDLLLHLIVDDKVDIYEVNLSLIVDAYLAEIERMDRCDLEVATEFLLIAATLVELKCRRLLPDDPSIDLDDELALWEERDLLLARLLECKTFKDAAVVLDSLADLASKVHGRTVGPDERFDNSSPDPLANVTPEKLRRAFLRAATAKPTPEVSLAHVSNIRVTVSATIETLCAELPSLGPVSFRRLTQFAEDRIEVVVHFLAVLELFKQGFVELDQRETFGDILVEWIGGADAAELAIAGADHYEG